jgi:hypothetical protein
MHGQHYVSEQQTPTALHDFYGNCDDVKRQVRAAPISTFPQILLLYSRISSQVEPPFTRNLSDFPQLADVSAGVEPAFQPVTNCYCTSVV